MTGESFGIEADSLSAEVEGAENLLVEVEGIGSQSAGAGVAGKMALGLEGLQTGFLSAGQ